MGSGNSCYLDHRKVITLSPLLVLSVLDFLPELVVRKLFFFRVIDIISKLPVLIGPGNNRFNSYIPVTVIIPPIFLLVSPWDKVLVRDVPRLVLKMVFKNRV